MVLRYFAFESYVETLMDQKPNYDFHVFFKWLFFGRHCQQIVCFSREIKFENYLVLFAFEFVCFECKLNK